MRTRLRRRPGCLAMCRYTMRRESSYRGLICFEVLMEKKSSSPELPADGRSQERAAAGSAAPARRGSSTRLIAILGTLAAYLFLAIWLRPEMAGPLSGPLTDLHDSVSDRLRKHPDR